MSHARRPLGLVRPTPNPHAVVKLREWLEMAERGEIVGVALAGEMSSGNQAISGYGGVHSSRLVGALEVLKARLVKKLCNDD